MTGPQSFGPGMSAATSTATTPGIAWTRARSMASMRAVGDRREAERRVQRAGELGQVVDVGRAAGDVQVRRLVRPRDADAGAGTGGGCFASAALPAALPAAASPFAGGSAGRIDGVVHGGSPLAAGATCGIALHTLVSLVAERRVAAGLEPEPAEQVLRHLAAVARRWRACR